MGREAERHKLAFQLDRTMVSRTEGIRGERERAVNQLQLNRKRFLENKNGKQGGKRWRGQSCGERKGKVVSGIACGRQEVKERVKRQFRETMSSLIWGERGRKPIVAGLATMISGA